MVTCPVLLLANFEEPGCLQAEGNVSERGRLDVLGKFLALEVVTCWNKKISLRDDEPFYCYCYYWFLGFGSCYVFVVSTYTINPVKKSSVVQI